MSLSTVEQSLDVGRWSGAKTHHPVAILAETRAAVAFRAALGICLAVASLALPWLGLSLTPSLSSWHLTFALGAVPLLGHVSYGEATATLTLCAIVSFVRSRGRATRVTRAVGWAFIALPVVFMVTTRLVGTATMFALQSDANQTQIINTQFLTNSNIPPPTQFLGVSLDPKTLLLLFGLRLGWYLLLVSGIILAGRVGKPATRLQWAAVVASGLAALTVVAGLVLGSLAQSDLDNGIQAVTDGQAATGRSLIASALRLDPSMAYDSGLQQALGEADADAGHQTALADYAEAVRPVGQDLTLLQKAQLYGEAVAGLPDRSPAATVVRADLATFLAAATIKARNPDLLSLVGGELWSPALTFSVGHFYYEAGANSQAITTLERTAHETGNSEVRSLALTYIALSWLKLNNEATFRSNIVAAVQADTLNENVYAREIAAGLYVPGAP
jgi:hypothetical protein